MSELGERLVDAINAVTGVHPGCRAAHATGVCATGSFRATSDATRVSRAAHFGGDPVAATVRFSNGTGVPARPDIEADGRGMAVKLHLRDGVTTDLVALSLPVFFVRTVDDFFDFTAARVPDPATGAPDPERLGAFLGAHPEALGAVQATLSARPPVSYATIPYFGIHAFRLVDVAGAVRFVRYRWEPAAGTHVLDEEVAGGPTAHYLREELANRLASGTAEFTLRLQLAAPGDDPTDPTIAWPDDRETVDGGTLTLDAFAGDGCDGMIFDPTRVVDGVECSDDPILHARAEAYGVSYARRTA